MTMSLPDAMNIIPNVANRRRAWYSPAGTSSRSTQIVDTRIVRAETIRNTNEKLSRKLSWAIIPFHDVAGTELVSDHMIPRNTAETAMPVSESVPVTFFCLGKMQS